MSDLWGTYPQLERWIGQICSHKSWGITGVSAMVADGDALLFEVTKPKHWRRQADGTQVAGIGAIGGSLEQGEQVLECLHREVAEELHAEIRVHSYPQTWIVYEHEPVGFRALVEAGYPRPFIFTVSENLYRRTEMPVQEILAIATFDAELRSPWSLGDLYGVIRVPKDQLAQMLLTKGLCVQDIHDWPGVELITQHVLEPGLRLEPTWTARSVQRLIQRGWRYGDKAWQQG